MHITLTADTDTCKQTHSQIQTKLQTTTDTTTSTATDARHFGSIQSQTMYKESPPGGKKRQRQLIKHLNTKAGGLALSWGLDRGLGLCRTHALLGGVGWGGGISPRSSVMIGAGKFSNEHKHEKIKPKEFRSIFSPPSIPLISKTQWFAKTDCTRQNKQAKQTADAFGHQQSGCPASHAQNEHHDL